MYVLYHVIDQWQLEFAALVERVWAKKSWGGGVADMGHRKKVRSWIICF